MFFVVNDPGPWQYFVTRRDNVGLPLMEVRNKYLHEQLLFENYMSFVQQQHMLMAQSAGGGGILPSTGSIDNTINDFVANDYVEDYFE
jgi:hypothetical protein